jgi:predicted AAA+ superfamily ATPase
VQATLIRESTTVILAGYRDEIEDLLAYNVGFASRFPLEFAFEDYDQKQICQILQTMVKDRGMQLERSLRSSCRRCCVPAHLPGRWQKGLW